MPEMLRKTQVDHLIIIFLQRIFLLGPHGLVIISSCSYKIIHKVLGLIIPLVLHELLPELHQASWFLSSLL